MPTFGSLFAGIGGLDLGLERAGWTCKWQVEIDEYRRRVLAKHWPGVDRYGDVRAIGPELESADLVCGGFPCQPISYAGRGKAQNDERWLWPEFHRIIRLVRPRFVLVENVQALLGRGLGDVLGDLAESGYDAEWDCIPAAAVGAPHIRDRIFVVAYSAGVERPAGAEVQEAVRQGAANGPARDHAGGSGSVADAQVFRLEWSRGARNRGSGLADGRGWPPEPGVGRVVDGFPGRVDRIRGLGDAVVPQVAEWIGRRLMEVVIGDGYPEGRAEIGA